MQEEVTVSVYRSLDDRLMDGSTNGSDSSPLSWDLHRLRAAGLHEAFDADQAGLHVLDWAIPTTRFAPTN